MCACLRVRRWFVQLVALAVPDVCVFAGAQVICIFGGNFGWECVCV